jgi:hypothetical protein
MLSFALIAMQAPGKLGMLFVVLVFCAVPLTILGEDPGFGVAPMIQCGLVFMTVAGSLWLGRRQSFATRIWRSAVAYLIATSISNLCALLLSPHLLH